MISPCQNSNEVQHHILPIRNISRRKYALGFRDVVNDALREVYNGAKGYVFTIEQLTEIVKFVPDVNVVKSNGIFYVSKEK